MTNRKTDQFFYKVKVLSVQARGKPPFALLELSSGYAHYKTYGIKKVTPKEMSFKLSNDGTERDVIASQAFHAARVNIHIPELNSQQK